MHGVIFWNCFTHEMFMSRRNQELVCDQHHIVIVLANSTKVFVCRNSAGFNGSEGSLNWLQCLASKDLRCSNISRRTLQVFLWQSCPSLRPCYDWAKVLVFWWTHVWHLLPQHMITCLWSHTIIFLNKLFSFSKRSWRVSRQFLL